MVSSSTQPEIDFGGRILILRISISIIWFICVQRESIFSIFSVSFNVLSVKVGRLLVHEWHCSCPG